LFVRSSTGAGNFEKNCEEMGSENMKCRELVHDNEYYFDDSTNPMILKKMNYCEYSSEKLNPSSLTIQLGVWRGKWPTGHNYGTYLALK